MTTQSSLSVLINGFGVLFVILNSFGLGLRLSVGKLLAEAFAHWKIAVWALVINFVIIPLLFIGYLLTIASSIPDEIKVGFCVAALCAGMPFAPLLARLAKADVSIATTLLVVLSAGTIIALPIGLPLAIDAVDAQLKTSAWDVAWPLLLFILLPVVLGCGFRVWWPDLTPPLAQWALRVAILCLLFNLNFTLVAYWDLFKQTWGTESYIAALAGPFIGLGCGYLLVSSLRVKDVGIRHATEATTAVRNIAPMLLMMIYPFAADPLVTVSITILNTIGITIVLLFVLMWRRAASPSDTARNNQPASKRRPAPANFDVTSDPWHGSPGTDARWCPTSPRSRAIPRKRRRSAHVAAREADSVVEPHYDARSRTCAEPWSILSSGEARPADRQCTIGITRPGCHLRRAGVCRSGRDAVRGFRELPVPSALAMSWRCRR